MNWRRQVALAILCGAAALVCLKLTHHSETAPEQGAGGQGEKLSEQERVPSSSHAGKHTSASAVQTQVAPDALSAAPPMQPPPASLPTTPVPATPESSSLPPETILENMGRTIRQYASAFGENPVGTNPEITSALQGDNPKHINFLKPDGNRVNSQGELVDSWGTPYFFHQISGHEMEIRSAGPDRILYTPDDLLTRE